MRKITEHRWFEVFFLGIGIRIYSSRNLGKKAKRKPKAEDLLAAVSRVIQAQTELGPLFGQKPMRIRSVDLVRLLKLLPGKKWADMTVIRLARKLKPFGIHPQNLRISGRVAKGYDLGHLIDNKRLITPIAINER